MIFEFLVGLFANGTAMKAAEDPINGKWTMDPAKSKYDPARDGRLRRTHLYENIAIFV